MLTRRDFITNGTALVTLGAAVPGVFRRAVTAGVLDGVTSAVSPGKTLIVVQLAGGNDGLNTVIPYADGAYRAARKTIGVPEEQIVRLDDRIGLHPKLAALKQLWDAKQLAIVEGVGYPDPNLSHFTSMHIWQTASPDGKLLGGWVGKYLDGLERHQHDPFHGFNVGAAVAPEMTTGATPMPAVANVQEYQPRFGAGADGQQKEQALLKLYEAYPKAAPYAALLETTLDDVMTTSKQVQSAASTYKPAVPYSKDPFGSGLQLLAEVVASEPSLRVGHITLGGFDTHADQGPTQERLLDMLANGLVAFMKDLEAHGKAEDVVVMTWSEFGRRVQENASEGTDHGTAAPLFVLGKAVRGGTYGEPPSLTNLDFGNLRFTTDFRGVYATLMEKWLQAPSGTILGGQFPTLGFL